MAQVIILLIAGFVLVLFAWRGVRRGVPEIYGGDQFPSVYIGSCGAAGVLLLAFGVIRLATG
jgi:hypothetical protein